MKFVEIFFYKDGKISKTSIFLSFATFILLLLWPFQCLFVGTTFFNEWWTVPEFNVSAGVTVLFTLSALYVANHKLRGQQEHITPEQLGELRQQVGDLVQSVKGTKNGD